MRFYEILCLCLSPALEDSLIVSRKFPLSKVYILSQILHSYLRIDTLSPSVPTVSWFHFSCSGLVVTSGSLFLAIESCSRCCGFAVVF